MPIANILRTRLQPREDITAGEWELWEHKTLNIHRGVLRWRTAARSPDLGRMAEMVREQVAARFRPSWWRGFAFGVLIEAESLPLDDLAGMANWIDIRAKGEGTWQWAIYASPPDQVAVGIHTWIEGYLSPVYRDLLDEYRAAGYEVGSARKEKDELMKFLTAVAKLKRIHLREFQP